MMCIHIRDPICRVCFLVSLQPTRLNKKQLPFQDQSGVPKCLEPLYVLRIKTGNEGMSPKKTIQLVVSGNISKSPDKFPTENP